MSGKLQHSWRSQLIFILVIIMLVSLFLSRAVLSLSMFAFVAASFTHRDIKTHLANFLTTPLLWSMTGLFLLPLLSGLWSEDTHEWLSVLRIKLPLLFLPLAFAGPFYLSQRQWQWLAGVFILLVVGGTCWTIMNYLQDADSVNNAYLRAKTMRTPLYDDHVRFSWLVSTAILTGGWLIFSNRKDNIQLSIILTAIIIWLIVFLHILAARTGLFSFYIVALGTAAWLIIRRLSITYAILIIVAVVALPLVAYKTVPSFKNRFKYVFYDNNLARKTIYLPGSSDGMRAISIKAGWNIMQEYPLCGAGFGDVLYVTKKWYAQAYPQMVETDKIKPGSEWIIYGAACGWPGFILFTLIMTVPLFVNTNNPLLWRLLNITAAASLLFDIGLEVQLGVFIYAFILLWWWKWFTQPIEKNTDSIA